MINRLYPIAFLPILNKEITDLTQRWGDEYLASEVREPWLGEERDDADVINFAKNIVASTEGAIKCCELCLDEWHKHEEISSTWKEELSELKVNYSGLKRLIQESLCSAALIEQLNIRKLNRNKGGSHV